MANVLADLSVAGQLALRALGRRLRAETEPAPDLEAFTRQMQALLERAPDGVIRDYHWLELPASQPPWIGSGLQLTKGEEVSYFIRRQGLRQPPAGHLHQPGSANLVQGRGTG